MRALVSICLAAGVLAFAAVGAGAQASKPVPAPVETAKAVETPTPESLLGDPYMITWEKDPRMRGREPFRTVLHPADGQTKQVNRIDLPRTPSEEAAFAKKAEGYLEEAVAALDEADFEVAEDRIEAVKQMSAIKLVTKTAADRMANLADSLAEAEKRLASMQARAALKEALEMAARMQAYFDNDRFGEVVDLHGLILELDNEKGLKNPEVATTAAALLEKCAEVARRANIHLEFAQLELKVDAVSHYPQGRSFAIVNGEVIGEGASVAPELSLASVGDKQKVFFDYKGERIAVQLAQ